MIVSFAVTSEEELAMIKLEHLHSVAYSLRGAYVTWQSPSQERR
jgi:hypothetical protein